MPEMAESPANTSWLHGAYRSRKIEKESTCPVQDKTSSSRQLNCRFTMSTDRKITKNKPVPACSLVWHRCCAVTGERTEGRQFAFLCLS